MMLRKKREPEMHFAALAAGVGFGVALGMLFAPKPGHKMRSELGRSAENGLNQLKRKVDDAHGSAAEMMDRGREYLASKKDSMDQAIEAGRKAYQKIVS